MLNPCAPARGPSLATARPLGASARPATLHARRVVLVRADIDKIKRQIAFNESVKDFKERSEQGEDEEQLVAETLGKGSVDELNETEQKYADAIRQKMKDKAAELKRQEEEANAVFNKGKYAYERGQYTMAEQLLNEALDDAGPFTNKGGEIQLWLALAYQAQGKEAECIALYKALEDSHPSKKIQKQAYDLRFIMEAPKLEIGKEEKIELPVVDFDRNESKKRGGSPGRKVPASAPRGPPTLEEKFLRDYKPPNWVQNKYVQTAAAIVLTLLAVAGQYLK